MSYVPILRSIFAPFLAHVHIGKALGYLPNTRTLYLSLATYSMINISTSSRCKEPSRCSLHQMRAQRENLTNMLPFILSCIRKPRFGSLDLSTYLGTCPSSCKLSLNLTMAATYAQVISKRELKELCSNFIETFH